MTTAYLPNADSPTPLATAVVPDNIEFASDNAPTLSIITITKNVDQWIDDCVRSILEDQDWDDSSVTEFELIIVDDHSTDATRAILDEYAQRDPRVRVIDNPLSGGGNARNVGMAAARGTYLSFVDGDDLVPPRAYKTMLNTITTTGSDMVVGDFMHFNDRRVWRPPRKWLPGDQPILRTTLKETPDLIRSRTVWNRMYRTDFLRTANVQFPNVPRANDIVPMTTALLAAKSIDIIPNYVYLYRHRPGGTSMTARAGQMKGYRSYLKQESICARMIAATNDSGITHAYRYFAARRFGASSLSMYRVYSNIAKKRARHYHKRSVGRVILAIRWRVKKAWRNRNVAA